jgi:DNA polymerase I
MIGLDTELLRKGMPATLLLQVHDELVLEVPGDNERAVAGLVRATMEGVHRLQVPLAVDIGVGASWAAAKE